MGRNSKLKAIKKEIRESGLAGKLKPVIVEKDRMERIMGRKLIEEGVTEVQGVKVDPKMEYRRNKVYIEYILHGVELRKFAKKYGAGYEQKYMEWLKGHTERMKKKYPAYFQEAIGAAEQVVIDPKLAMM